MSHQNLKNDMKKSSTSSKDVTKRTRRDDDNGWGGFTSYRAAKKYKLGAQFNDSDKQLESGLFHGVSIYVNGYTKPSSDELRRLIVAHGGNFEMYLSKKSVTHIVATNLPNSKFHLAKTTFVVKPDWITDSIAANKRLPHTSYLLFGNKSKLQTGLTSFPSHTMNSRSSSTSTSSSSSLVTNIQCTDAKDNQNVNNKRSNSDCSEASVIVTQPLSSNSESQGLTGKCSSIDSEDVEMITSSLSDEEKEKENADEVEIVYNSEEEDASQLTKRLSILHSPTVTAHSKSRGKDEDGGSSSSPATTPTSSNTVRVLSFADCLNLESPSRSRAQKNENPVEIPLQEMISGSVSYDQAAQSVSNNNLLLKSPMSSSKDFSPSNLLASSNSMGKAGDKGFLTEYYSNSRLHHIATWGAEFKAYIADIQQRGNASFPGRAELRHVHVENTTRLGMPKTLHSANHGNVEKTVLHIDMDCFFVSVGLLSRPHLKGKPVAVTHSRGQGSKPDPKSNEALERHLWNAKKDGKLKNKSLLAKDSPTEYDVAIPKGKTGFQTFHSMAEIASCSYECRKAGVKNGMFMGRAKTLCPDLQTIPYDFDEYNRISRILYDTVASFTHEIEAVSCDEMYVDCSDVLSDTGASAKEFAQLVRSQVLRLTDCTASVGIGPNILLARMATKKAKPDGVFQVYKNEAKDFITDQSVSDLPGVGYSMSSKLTKMGVKTCRDLQSVPVSTLQREFGRKTGESLHSFSLGLDDRLVKGNKQRKSVSAEVNYGIRFTQESDAVTFLQELSDEVAKRLDNFKVKGRSITLKLMIKRPDAPEETAKFMGHGICNTITKSSILPMATSDGGVVGKEVVAMYRYHRVSACDVRGIGIQVQRLESTEDKDQQTHGHQSILHFAFNKKLLSAGSSTTAVTNTNSATTTTTTTTITPKKGGETNEGIVEEGYTGLRPNDRMNPFPVGIVAPSSPPAMYPSLEGLDMRDVSFLLSPSQVHENILDELPVDIAEELRGGIERHKKQKKNMALGSSSSRAPTIGKAQPSPVLELADAQQFSDGVIIENGMPLTAGQENHSDRKVEEGLPSASQLDMSCFHALPRSLQKELEIAYARQDQTHKPSSPIKGTALAMLRSPAKEKPLKKKGRGRPVGSKNGKRSSNKKRNGPKPHTTDLNKIRPRANISSASTNEKTTEKVSDQSPFVDDVVWVDDEDSTSRDTVNDQVQDQINTDTTTTSNLLNLNVDKVTFCGAYNMTDVRGLFKEWINSCPEPQEEDMAMVTDYLTSLVHHKSLEQVFCLLKFLLRRVHVLSMSPVWKGCVEIIATHVQSVVIDLHGAELKLL